MENRRNYYRILQVQPDAPQALITASYRTLMQKLKYHPDLGGDHWNAALLNEAFHVLSDPQRRAEYDRSMGDSLFNFHRREPAGSGGAGTADYTRNGPPSGTGRTRCLFCHTPDAPADGDDQHLCSHCGSPLQPVEPLKLYPELRRTLDRVELDEEIQYYTDWPQAPRPGRLCDISPTGLALNIGENLQVDEIIKIESRFISAVGSVVHARTGTRNGWHRIGVKLLTATFQLKQGTFLNVEI